MQDESVSIDYNLPNYSKKKWVIYGLSFFLFVFFLYFPIGKKVNNLIKASLNTSSHCSINYENITFGLFFPKIIINDLQIPGNCFSPNASNLKFKELFLHFRGISFSPLGPHLMLETEFLKTPIKSYITLSFNTLAVNIQKLNIELESLKDFFQGIELSGTMTLDSYLELSSSGLKSIKAQVYSKNLVLPAQKISAFSLSRMKLANLLLKVESLDGTKLNVKDFVLGDTDSPIRSNFKGDIKLNLNNIMATNLNLLGEVAFSDEFLENYSVLNLVLDKFNKEDDFYQIQLNGPLSNPNPQSVKK